MGKNIKRIIDRIKDETRIQTIEIEAKKQKDVSIFKSKFGGYPYIPKDSQAPIGSNGVMLKFLCQIVFSELPENDIYPKNGILQFYISRDDMLGLDFEDQTSQENFRIIYYEDIDFSVSLDEIRQKYILRFEDEEDFSPVQESYSLSFFKKYQSMTVSDYRFRNTFMKYYNEINGEDIKNPYEVYGQIDDETFEELSPGGHRIGGYPDFTQEDVRETYKNYDILLLQIDSTDDIMWGDCGIGNFFITDAQLKKRDFSKVLFNWDCC